MAIGGGIGDGNGDGNGDGDGDGVWPTLLLDWAQCGGDTTCTAADCDYL